MGPGDRRGGMTGGWIWDAFAVEPGGLTEGLDGGCGMRPLRERERRRHMAQEFAQTGTQAGH